jgi:periplasmic copper chaperone A
MNFRSLVVVAALSISTIAAAREPHRESIVVGPSFARASLPGQNSGAAYLSLENKSANADALLSVTTPLASDVEIHTMAMQDNVMRMRQVPRIDLPAGAKVSMQPGKGYHLMLTGLKAPLKAGDTLPLVLRFQQAGTVEVSLPVEGSAPGMPMNMH